MYSLAAYSTWKKACPPKKKTITYFD